MISTLNSSFSVGGNVLNTTGFMSTGVKDTPSIVVTVVSKSCDLISAGLVNLSSPL